MIMLPKVWWNEFIVWKLMLVWSPMREVFWWLYEISTPLIIMKNFNKIWFVTKISQFKKKESEKNPLWGNIVYWPHIILYSLLSSLTSDMWMLDLQSTGDSLNNVASLYLYLLWWGGHCCPMHCDLFKIYCTSLNLGIRTWICRLNFAQRTIFPGLRFFNEPEIPDSGPPA